MSDSMNGFRLSPQQKRLWLLQQDAGAAFGAHCVVMISGGLRVELLRRALSQVVERQEILRTRFHRRPGIRIPIQVIEEVGEFAWQEFALAVEDEARQHEKLEEQFNAAKSRGFDFERDPALCVSLCKLSPERHALLFSLPALCADMETLENLTREIAAAYEAVLNGEWDGDEEEVQYLQFSEWHNELLESESDEPEGRAFWREQQVHSISTLTFNLEDRHAAATQEFAPAALAFKVSPADLGQIDALAQTLDTSPELFLLACWCALTRRLAAQADIVIGHEFDGRKFEELDQALGPYARVLQLRCEFEEDISFSELLRLLTERHHDAEAWQEYFNWDEFAAAQEGGESAFCPVIFDFHERAAGVQHRGGLKFSLETTYYCIERFRLRLSLLREDAALDAELFYDPRFFDAETIERLARHFQRLLSDALAEPSKSVNALELLDTDDHRRLLHDFNRTAADFPQHECLQHLFEEMTGIYPQHPAVVFEGQRLTYLELNARSNRLARYLRSRGVGAGAFVGLCVERSLEMIIGLLAIMKAGAAYVPLDPDQPQSRLDYQLKETGARVLLTQEKLLPRLPASAVEAVCLDRDEHLYASLDEENPERVNYPAHPAYVIYTSGSTGAPKGVVVSHQNLMNYAWFVRRMLELDQTPAGAPLSFATVTTIAADLGNTCIFSSLITGGCLHLLSYEVATDGRLFAAYVSEHPVDVLKIVPSHFSALLKSTKDEDLLPRRFLIFGGEALPFDLVKRVNETRSACRLINHYGPTETTVGSLVNHVTAGAAHDEAAARTVPIGKPIANTVAYILDAKRRLVPVGVAGELFIGGTGVALGYLNKPDKTAEQFLPDPFSSTPGARLYRTGDLARFLPGGAVEFLGRVDHQVKIRGFRIEPGEIEARLREHAAVRDALVVAREDAQGHKRLVAYVVPQREKAPPIGELRAILQQDLPVYLIPSSFVTLRALPLTPNGKIDRRALPEPGQERLETERGFVAPRTPTEEKLAGIWREVLGIAQVGAQDNFFELGGDSILSLQIVARANGEGIRLTPKQLFEHPTVGELALLAGDDSKAEREPETVSGVVPLTPIQRWFFEQNFTDSHHWNMSMLLDVRQPLDVELVERAFERLLEHHDALRIRFERDGEVWRQVNAETSRPLQVIRVDLSTESEDVRERIFEQEATRIQASMSLAEPPLLRLAYFEMGGGEPRRLLLAVHHLVVDGVSWRVLLEDLQTAYRQLAGGEAVKFPPKTTSFKTWATRLHEYAQGEALRREAVYWLANVRAPLAGLPLDKMDGGAAANTLASARSVSISLDAETTQALLHTAHAAYGVQANEMLLAALARSLTRWTGANTHLINLEGHGRESLFDDVDVSRTVGWFTTHFPVMLEGDAARPPAELVANVREQLRHVPQRGIGYGLLRYLREDEAIVTSLRRLPQPQISFNYLGQLDQTLRESEMFALRLGGGGLQRAPGARRAQVLQINCGVSDAKLWVSWGYSENLHERATVEALAHNFADTLRDLVRSAKNVGARILSPSDFPESDLSAKELASVLGRPGFHGQDEATADVEDIYALSPMQEGMLFHSLQAAESSAYFRQLSFIMRGRLDVEAFEKAWQKVFERHGVLRTAFLWEGLKNPVQIIYRRVPLPLEKLDWRGLSGSERDERLRTLSEDERERNFDITRAPLMRMQLVTLGDDTHYFVWSYHHLVLEAWSRTQLNREVLALYEAYSQGREVELPPTVSYRVYIAWLRRQDTTKARDFWREQLKGFRPPTPLPILTSGEPEHAAAAVATQNHVREHKLSRDRTAALQTAARRLQLTLNTLAQGAWALWLSRYSGDEDVVFGNVVSGRPAQLEGVETIVGLFINTLPLRVRVAPGARLHEWLKQIQQRQAAMSQYEYSPLVDIHGWSGVPRHVPLFQTVLNFGNYPHYTRRSAGDEEPLRVEEPQFVEGNHYPLALEIATGEELLLRTLYDTRYFDEEAVNLMLEQVDTLLSKMIEDGDCPVRDLLSSIQVEAATPAGAADQRDTEDDAEAQFTF